MTKERSSISCSRLETWMTGNRWNRVGFWKNIKGKLCADKGYIGQVLFENLFLNGIQLVTKVKNNMRNSLMSIADKILLRKRALIETVNDELKNIAQIEHSRHRSFSNFIANSLSAIAAYCFFEKKPAIDVKFVNDGQLAIFWFYFELTLNLFSYAVLQYEVCHLSFVGYLASCGFLNRY